jgi:hypothetical protein
MASKRLIAVDSWRLLRRDGARGLGHRALRAAHRRWGQPNLDFPLLPGDIASSDALTQAGPRTPRDRSQPLTIGWLTVPPAAGSGGHTTMFRVVEALERAGHTCVLYLYDRYHGDLRRRRDVIRSCWPQIKAEVRDVDGGVAGVDALVATSWDTAHLVMRQRDAVRRCFYFVQDYEPYFYPHGSEYALAEDTYRFGFHGLTAGRWLATMLSARYDMPCDFFEFGADTDVYRYTPAERDGVVFYAKPNVARRGYELGVEVLREFARRHPSAPIHLFGEDVSGLPFTATSHGSLTPERLNALYNTCRVGLSLSFTNVSLVPWELLSSGVVPVVNDAEHNRMVLDNECVSWALASVGALADAMSETYERYTPEVGSQCAASVEKASWTDAADAMVAAIERETP